MSSPLLCDFFSNNLYTENKKGGVLIDSFTGSQKTSSFIEYLYKKLSKENSHQELIYFITPRMVNVESAYQLLKSKLSESEHHKIIKINSNQENLYNIIKYNKTELELILSKIVINAKIDSKILSKKIDKDKQEIIGQLKLIKETIEDNKNEYIRYESCKKIIHEIYKKVNSITDKVSYLNIQEILSVQDMRLFDEFLFPSMLIRKNQVNVVFCTTQKALSGFIEPKGLFLPFQYSENATFFLDESDSQYNEMINFLSNKQNYDLYHHLKNVLMSLSTLPGVKKDDFYYDKKKQSFNKLFQDFKQKEVLPFIEKFSPFLNLKYLVDDDNAVHFLLDSQNNIHTSGEKNLNYKVDIENLQNYITKETSTLTLKDFIIESHNFLDYKFSKFLDYLLKNMIINKKYNNPKKTILFNEEITKILNDFNLYSENEWYQNNSLLNRLKENIQHQVTNKTGKEIYENSLKYTSLYKSEEDKIEIKSIYVPYSPNFIINKLMKKNQVIFCSSTANAETSIHNFDMKYIKENHELLTFDKLTKEKIVTIKNRYKESYNNEINIEITPINKNYLEEIENDKLLTLKEINVLTENKDYTKERINKMLHNINLFIDKNHKYGVFYLPQLINEDKIKILNKLISIQYKESNFEVVAVSSKDLKENIMKEIWDKFKKNSDQKTIILTHYNTINSGINLQRPCHEDEFLFIPHKDIDFMFMEMPTDLLQPSFNLNQSSILTAIMNIQSLHIKNNISIEVYKKTLNNLLKKSQSGNFLYLNKLYKSTEDYNQTVLKIVEQSVGRMSRTFNKHDNNTISVSQELALRLKNKLNDKDLTIKSYEFEVLMKNIIKL